MLNKLNPPYWSRQHKHLTTKQPESIQHQHPALSQSVHPPLSSFRQWSSTCMWSTTSGYQRQGSPASQQHRWWPILVCGKTPATHTSTRCSSATRGAPPLWQCSTHRSCSFSCRRARSSSRSGWTAQLPISCRQRRWDTCGESWVEGL